MGWVVVGGGGWGWVGVVKGQWSAAKLCNPFPPWWRGGGAGVGGHQSALLAQPRPLLAQETRSLRGIYSGLN